MFLWAGTASATVQVKGFARDVTLSGKVLRLTFDQGGRRFKVVYAKEDGQVYEQELLSRPGIRLYDMRHFSHPPWTGRATDVGVSGVGFANGELIEPDLGDELSLLFSHFPMESANSNALRGYSFFGIYLQWILIGAVLLGAGTYAGCKRDRRVLPTALLGSLAIAWGFGEAVVFNDHWGHAVHRGRNVNVARWHLEKKVVDGFADHIGEAAWGHAGLSSDARDLVEYRLAGKPLRPVKNLDATDFMLIERNDRLQIYPAVPEAKALAERGG